MNKMRQHTRLIIITLVIAGLALGGIIGWHYYNSDNTQTLDTNSSTVATSITADDSDDIDWTSLPTTNITLSNGTTITASGTYVLSGTSTGQVHVKSDGYVRLVLDNATISSDADAALYIESAKKTVIQLAANSQNTIIDATTHTDENIDAALYSADDLVIDGDGSLNITAHFADGIVSKDDLWINSGNITITSADDGIRGKDSLNVIGGTITIDAQGDGMKSSNDTDAGKGQLVIAGGAITIDSGDDAIKAEQKISITGGTITVTSSVEGIEAPIIVIDDGDISVYATDDGINASTSAIITTGLSVTINGGSVYIEVGAGDTDAIDSNGDLWVNGGIIDIIATTSSFDFDGNGAINGGTITVNGQQITEMPTQMMPGGGMGGRR